MFRSNINTFKSIVHLKTQEHILRVEHKAQEYTLQVEHKTREHILQVEHKTIGDCIGYHFSKQSIQFVTVYHGKPLFHLL